MRGSLDHCVKCTICETVLPGVQRDAAVPRARSTRARRPSATASRDERRRRLGGLLLGLRHLHAGVPAGRAHRRDQLAGALAREGARRRQAARPRPRPPDVAGRAGTPGRAAGELDAAQPPAADRRSRSCSASTATPRCRTFAGPARSRAGRRSTRRRRRAEDRLLPRLRDQLLRARHRRALVEILEHNGFEVEVPKGQDCCGLPLQSNGLFDDARSYVAPPRAQARARRPRRRTDRRQLHQLHADAQARGARDPPPEDDAELKLVAERTYDICELLLDLHDRGELQHRLPRVQETVAYHAPASSRATGSASRRSSCSTSSPSWVTEKTPAAAGSRGRTGSRQRSARSPRPSGAALFEQVRASGAAVVACDSETCRWQLEEGHRAARHAPGRAAAPRVRTLVRRDGRHRHRLAQRAAGRGRRRARARDGRGGRRDRARGRDRGARGRARHRRDAGDGRDRGRGLRRRRDRAHGPRLRGHERRDGGEMLGRRRARSCSSARRWSRARSPRPPRRAPGRASTRSWPRRAGHCRPRRRTSARTAAGAARRRRGDDRR